MADYYPRRMRVVDQEEKRMIRRIIIGVGGTIVVLLFLFFAGIPALLSLGSVFTLFKDDAPSNPNANTPIISPRLEALDSATNSAKIAVSGIGQQGTSVELFVNDQSVAKNVIGKDGDFRFENVQLKEGQNSIFAKSSTDDGKESTPSQKQTIILDKIPPQVEISSPSENQDFKGQKDIKVSGKTEENATVSVNETVAITNQDGSFSTNLTLSEGQTTIKIIVTDIAGNQNTIQRVVNYQP